MLFAGCALMQPPGEPVTEDRRTEVVSDPSPAPSRPARPSKVPAPPPLPSVAIVLTNNQPAYADVARELTRRFDKYDVYDLSDSTRPPVTTLRLINDSAPGAVIAIGLRAAQSSVSMSRQPVVFSQVFNYQHHQLLQDNSRGVAALPPLDAQLAAWKDIDPTVKRIGMIVGEGHDDLISEAQIAADRHAIEVIVQVTRSDQETLYFFRRMIRDIDGFLLFPDNRVLSTRVLQQMLADANRQSVPVSVPSESMLALGAMISMTSEASDIAESIVKIVRAIQAGKIDRIPPITRLTEIRVNTNGSVPVVQR
jgi:ABC-type uncharacterized transport system substrate-binding protein